MNCELSEKYMMEHFDGELDDMEEVQLMRHIKSCSSCHDAFTNMKDIFAAIEAPAEIEPPNNFVAMVMEKVSVIENERKEKDSRRIVLVYNAATLLSIVLLLLYVADLKQVSVLNAFEQIGSYFNSFSSVTAAVFGVVEDILGLIGGALLVVFDVAFTIFRSYYYVFIALVVLLFAIRRLLNYVGTQSGGGAE